MLAEEGCAGYAQGLGRIRSGGGRIRSATWPDTLSWSRIRSVEPERMRPKNQRFFFEIEWMSAAELLPERIRLGRIRSARSSWVWYAVASTFLLFLADASFATCLA